MDTSNNHPVVENYSTGPSKGHSTMIGVLAAGLVLALAGDGYLIMRSNHLTDDLAKSEMATQTQLSKVNEATQVLLQQEKQRLDGIAEQFAKDVKTANDSATVAVRRARTDAEKKTAELNAKLAEAQAQVASELTQIKDNTASKFTEVSGNVDTVKTSVDEVKANVTAAQTELAKTGADLKRVMGDMGVMSGLIATNSKDLETLRALGDRNYYEFDITKQQGSRKIGDVTVQLKRADAKRNRFTMEVLADDKRVEKKDKTINEPVQFYTTGNMHPYEIVVNQVSKDHVVGYLSTPKVKMARR